MPIYEYQCKACGHQLEAFQKMSESPLTECPSCHAAALNKLISSTSFQLKGTGWYATDFRDKGKPKPAATDESGSSGSDAGAGDASSTKSTESKTDSKTDTKTDTKTKTDSKADK